MPAATKPGVFGKPSNLHRITANSIEPVMREVKMLAVRQVYRGHEGTVQDLVNYVLLGLVDEPETADRLYDKGLKNWEILNSGGKLERKIG